MKKTRLIALIMVVVLAVSLCSCSLFGGNQDVAKLLDTKSSYVEKPAASSVSEVSSLASYTSAPSSAGDLVVLSYSSTDTYGSYNTTTYYAVYNVVTGSTVYTVSNYSGSGSSSTSIYVNEINDVSYFYTVTTNYISVGSGTNYTPDTYVTVLYDANGNTLDSVSEKAIEYPSEVYGTNLIEFNGNYFEAEDGYITRAFESNPFQIVPEIVASSEEFYYSYDGELIFAIYDKQFEKVATYKLPEYFDEVNYVVLPEGNLLVQYNYAVDINADKYDVISNEGDAKYNLVTVVVDADNGKAKEIKCDYYINYGDVLDEEYITENVLDAKKFEDGIVSGYKIENNRLSNEFSGFINKNGKITEFPTLEGENVLNIAALAADRWVVMTETYSYYLIDEKGEVLGVLNNAEVKGDYLVADGKIYDYNLNVLFNYESGDYEIASTIGGNLLLTRSYEYYYMYQSGYTTVTDYFIFNGAGEPKLLVNGSENVNETNPNYNSSYYPTTTTKSVSVYGNCYAITTTTRSYNYQTYSYTYNDSVELFNEDGTSLKSVTASDVSISELYVSEDNGMLLRVSTTNNYGYNYGYGSQSNTTYTYWFVK